MAGLGFKDFADGDVLTAAQVQGYLQDQAVMKFADSSARTTALGTAVAEGMLSYLDDTDAVEYYDGSAWQSVGPTTVGKVLQVVSATKTDTSSTTSSTYQDVSGLSVTITPTSASSKILLTGSAGLGLSTTSGGPYGFVRLIRDATPVGVSGAGIAATGMSNNASSSREFYTVGWSHLDSPATTSAITYKVQFKRDVASATVYIGRNGFSATYYAASFLTAIEVGP